MHRAVRVAIFFALNHCIIYAAVNKAKAAMVAADLAHASALANTFEAGVPSAQVVRLPNADHFVFRSNEAGVSREMNVFLAKLP
jgi:hypothetical protein